MHALGSSPAIHRPLRDPLFHTALCLYMVGRACLQGPGHAAFWSAHLGDLLLVPIWAPLMVQGLRALGLRRGPGPPTGLEVWLLVLTVAVTFVLAWLHIPFYGRH